MSFLYDLPNFIAIAILVFVSFRFGMIPAWLATFLLMMGVVPFLLNDVVFPSAYFSDQYRYTHVVQHLRQFSNDHGQGGTVLSAGYMLALVPLPFVETIKSLGFFNRFMFTGFVIWIYAYKKMRGWPLLFLIFYPSIILYTSLSLRDTLVFVIMMFAMINFIDNKRLIALLFSLPLIFIKFQNFFLILLFFILFLSFTKGTFFYKVRYFIIPSMIVISVPFLNEVIFWVDFYRRAMFIEDGGDMDQYIQVSTFIEFMILGIQSAPYFLMKPFPWEASNFFQFIQSIENLFVMFFLVFFFSKVYKIDSTIVFKWILFLFISMTVYGLVVFNYGTAVRYRFPFIVMVVIGAAYECYKYYGVILFNRKLNIKNLNRG